MAKKNLTPPKSVSSLKKLIPGGVLTFGTAIQTLRTREKISQAEFARKIGVPRQYICDVEKGRNPVSVAQAARFAEAFGHKPTVLVQVAIEDELRAVGLNLQVRIRG